MFSHTLEAFAHGTQALPGCWEIWNCFLRILKMRCVAWKALYHFQGSRRYFILWCFVDHVLMLFVWWLFVDILFMYSHDCLAPTEMLYIDRCHSHHADDVRKLCMCTHVLNCVKLSAPMLVYFTCFEKSYFTSHFKSQLAVNSPSLLAFKEASCTSCMSS